MLLSIGGKAQDAPFLRPINGMFYSFQPIEPVRAEGHQSSARMLELVILANSPDCPDVSLRHEDGHFHTGDLFIEPAPGLYVFRGRDDDWIKTQYSLRCDTKYDLPLKISLSSLTISQGDRRQCQDHMRSSRKELRCCWYWPPISYLIH